MTKTDGLLRSDDYDDDLSRNNLFTVHKKAIYLDTFNLALSLLLPVPTWRLFVRRAFFSYLDCEMESARERHDSNLRQVVENFSDSTCTILQNDGVSLLP